MRVNDPKDLFVLLLSNVLHGTERATKMFEELGDIAQDPDIKQILAARTFLSNKIVNTLDEVFDLIDAKPVEYTGRLHDVFFEDWRKEFNEIQSPAAKRLFVLAKLSHLTHLRIGEYKALVAAADMTGNYEVGLLLESCLADKMVMADRTKTLIKHIIATKAGEYRMGEKYSR